MNVRRAVAGLFLVVASSACSAQRPANPAAGSEPRPVAKEVCQHDEDCSPYHACTSDNHCRCEIDADCAPTQACRAGLCLPR